jgi:hypothetical protein
MYVLPFAFHTSLSEDAILELENSDKIYLHMQLFEEILGNSNGGELIILELKSMYDCGLPIAVNIGGFHSFEDKNIIYAPSWIVEHLGVTEHCTDDDKTMCEVSYKRIMPSPCAKITIQPFETLLSKYDDPEMALQTGLEKYTCLYANSTISLLMPDKKILKCSIYDCEPKKDFEPLCIRDIELVVNLLPAKDYIVPVPKVETGAVGGAGIISHTETPFHGYTKHDPRARKFAPKGYVPFGGKGYRLDGKDECGKGCDKEKPTDGKKTE